MTDPRVELLATALIAADDNRANSGPLGHEAGFRWMAKWLIAHGVALTDHRTLLPLDSPQRFTRVGSPEWYDSEPGAALASTPEPREPNPPVALVIDAICEGMTDATLWRIARWNTASPGAKGENDASFENREVVRSLLFGAYEAESGPLSPAPLGEPQTVTAQQSTRTMASGAGLIIDHGLPASPLGERGPQESGYDIRKCRGTHYHVTCGGDDLSLQGDPYKSEAEAWYALGKHLVDSYSTVPFPPEGAVDE